MDRIYMLNFNIIHYSSTVADKEFQMRACVTLFLHLCGSTVSVASIHIAGIGIIRLVFIAIVITERERY